MTPGTPSSPIPTSAVAATPTVVLVHGAFTDGSSWAAVADRLLRAGVPVLVPANPLRGLRADGAAVAAAIRPLGGPLLLVGHGYGGAVITQMGAQTDQVRGLVFIASFGLDLGETIGSSSAGFPGSLLAATLAPDEPSGAGELFLPVARFAEVFGADLPAHRTAVLARTQRPLSAAALTEPLTIEPAWRTRPSWVLVTTQDNAVRPAAQRAAVTRLQATSLEVEASHAVLLSQPETVTVFILKALAAIASFC